MSYAIRIALGLALCAFGIAWWIRILWPNDDDDRPDQ